jgi:RNA polymerase sigma-70 factor, ECF subfamily
MPQPLPAPTSPLMSTPTDRALFDQARTGNTEAFGQLVRRHQARIYRVALHMLRDKAAAEDIAQETFVRAFRAMQSFDGRSEPYTWIYRIAVNLALNAIRSRKVATPAADVDDPRLESALISRNGEDPSREATRKEMYGALCEAIDSLSESLRTTLILVCVDGVSHEDAAAILGAPEGTIAWRVHEARRKLREFLVTRGFDPEVSSARAGKGLP